MSNNDSGPAPIIESWDAYWQGAETGAAYSDSGTSDPGILSFWDRFFRDLKARDGEQRIIDVASGNGAVVAYASTVFGEPLSDFTCLDISPSAMRSLEERFPGVHGLIADASAIPLDSGSFDVATSQFGIEYAGIEAIDEVARLIAPDGELALLLHYRDGKIYRQCGADLSAVEDMREAKFIPYCIEVFEAGFALLSGGDRARYRAAGEQFAPAIRAMEAIMVRHGREVAAGAILQMYRDVRTLHAGMRDYEPAAVTGWLEKIQQATDAYARRMASMRDAALDGGQFEHVCAGLREKGFDVVLAAPLTGGDSELPLAWSLIARKRPVGGN